MSSTLDLYQLSRTKIPSVKFLYIVVTSESRVARLANMRAQSSGGVHRQLFVRIIKEQLPWTSGRTITPKCRFSAGSFGMSNALPGPNSNTVVSTSMGSGGLRRKLGLSTRGADLLMVRRAEGLGGLRQMGIIERPAGRAAQHGVRTTLPSSDEEKHTDEFLKAEKRKQAAKVMKTEKAVGTTAGQSMAATDAEFVQDPGRNTADTQKDIAEEMTMKSEWGAGDTVDQQSGSRQQMDANAQHPDVDEEVKRGLVADSALPMGRPETKENEEEVNSAFKEDEHTAQMKVDFSEHGSFKTL